MQRQVISELKSGEQNGIITNGKVPHHAHAEKAVQKPNDIQEQCVLAFSFSSIIIIPYSILLCKWLMPFIYVFLWTFLFAFRIISFWKRKRVFLLADFCYFVNILYVIFLCMPTSQYLFTLMFIFANGPVIWATRLFVDCIMLHRIHRMSTSFFHYVPALMSFCIRWYPEKMSKYWFRDISTEIPEFSFLWSCFIPLALFIAYYFINYIIVCDLIKPSAEYKTIYSILNEDGFTKKIINTYGKRSMFWTLFTFLSCYGALTMVGSVIALHYFEAHCFLILGILFMTIMRTVAVIQGRAPLEDDSR